MKQTCHLSATAFWARYAGLVLLTGMLLDLRAQDATTNAPASRSDLTSMPIEKLMEIEVYSPSKRPQKLSETAAAISVVTQDDIHRSGATSIPEALRLVPGLDVAQVDSEQWAISARGFNDIFANKLLVLMDGRSVYTPLFSGVFWNVQDTLMEDIERIEVIRGPGGSLWGANAVNGVISILTRSAKDTQGWLFTGGGGTQERGFFGARYGGALGDDLYFRVYGKYFDRAETVFPNGDGADNAWEKGQGGFRLDWDKTEQSGNLLTLQGDIYGSSGSQSFTNYAPTSPPLFFEVVHQDDYQTSGGNVLGRWTHTFSDTSELKLQMYYDHTRQDSVIFKENLDTFDIDLQHQFALGNRNHVVWGLGYRLNADRIDNSDTVSFDPTSRTTMLYSGFAQDEFTLVPERLRLTGGVKLEHNDYTGLEVQPSGRLLWTPTPEHSFWAAISRAVRTPSRAEEDVQIHQVIPPTPTLPASTIITIDGNRNFESETVIAYELGYRLAPMENVSFDLASFYNNYDHLRSQQVVGPLTGPPPALFIPTQLQNGLHGDTYGLELAANWQVADWWRLRPSYTFLEMQLHRSAGDNDLTPNSFYEGTSPEQQCSLRSSMDLPWHLTFDATFRYVDELPALRISSYVAMDLRLGWHPHPNLEFAVVGQNLLNSQHGEFAPTFIGTPRTEIPQSVYVQVTWSFGGKH